MRRRRREEAPTDMKEEGRPRARQESRPRENCGAPDVLEGEERGRRA